MRTPLVLQAVTVGTEAQMLSLFTRVQQSVCFRSAGNDEEARQGGAFHSVSRLVTNITTPQHSTSTAPHKVGALLTESPWTRQDTGGSWQGTHCHNDDTWKSATEPVRS